MATVLIVEDERKLRELARRITSPVARLIALTRAMAGGDRAARAGPIRAPGELRVITFGP